MKIAGSATLRAPIDRVFEALNDPAVLVRTIPGCQQLEETSPDNFTATIYAGVASIKGVYQGKVVLTDRQAPESFRLKASGAGAPGTVDADVLVQLFELPDGGTRLDYDADALVGGMIGGVGQRMLGGVAKKTARDFFKAVDADLNGENAASSTQPSHPVEAQNAEAAHITPPKVFTAPAGAKPGIVGDFTAGVALGAVVALVGVLIGSRAARAGKA